MVNFSLWQNTTKLLLISNLESSEIAVLKEVHNDFLEQFKTAFFRVQGLELVVSTTQLITTAGILICMPSFEPVFQCICMF